MPEYIQHNPLVPTGREAAVNLLTPRVTKDSVTDIKRVIADGDLVVLHVHMRNNLTDRGRAVIDIFRVANRQDRRALGRHSGRPGHVSEHQYDVLSTNRGGSA